MECRNFGELVKTVRLCARIILENGGETYRAEETVNRICQAYGYDESDVFATPTGVFISVSRADGESETCIVRIRKRGVDLEAIDCVNTVSRRLTSGQMELCNAIEVLQSLNGKKPEKVWLSALAAGLSSGFFALLFRGSAFDFFAAMFCGVIVRLISSLIKTADMFNFTSSLLGGFLIGVGSVLCVQISGMGNLDKIISGAMMPLLPGVSMTNAIRDTMRGDLVSGVSRAAEALLIAVSLAFGAGVVMKIYFQFLQG